MKVVRLSVSSSVKEALVGCAVIFAVVSTAFAAPSEKEIPFKETKFRGVKVRHVPTPANDKSRQIPAPGTPRTELPVLDAPGPKGGKVVHTDNTYLIHCPPPAPQSQANKSAPMEAKNSASDSRK
jgi:hypothetical protein